MSWAIAPTRSCLLGLCGTGIVSNQWETSRVVGIEKEELKNTLDHLRHNDGVTKTFTLVPQSGVEESQHLDGCWQQDID